MGTGFKGIVNNEFCHHLLTLKLLQTCMSFCLLLNTKQHILKNVGKQTVAGSHWLHTMDKILWKTMATGNRLFPSIGHVWNNSRVRKWVFNGTPEQNGGMQTKLKVMQWSKTMFKITSQKCSFCFNSFFVVLSISILFVLLAEKTLQMTQSLKQLLRMFSTHVTTTHFYKTWSSNNTISDWKL